MRGVEPVEQFMKKQNLLIRQRLFDFDHRHATIPAAFLGMPSPCPINQNLPHRLRGHGEEMGRTDRLKFRPIQFQPDFMDEGGRIESEIGRLLSQFRR